MYQELWTIILSAIVYLNIGYNVFEILTQLVFYGTDLQTSCFEDV